jgi:hypothetical protein
MIELDWTRCKLKPAPEQMEGVRALVKYDAFAIFDEMGFGKSKQTIDAACFLYDAGVIDTVVVACPAPLKVNWVDRVFGQIQEHAFVPSVVTEFTSDRTFLPVTQSLLWVAVSYEYGRREEAMKALRRELRGRKILIVADESRRLASPKSQQTKAFNKLRDACDRAVVMTGTPGPPEKVFQQMWFLDPKIVGCKNWYHFLARYCVMGGFKGKKIVKYLNKEEFDALTVPRILRRPKPKDVPSKQFHVMSVPLEAKTWKMYKAMRDQMVVWLDGADEASVAKHAVTKYIRLAQITSGFLGGVENVSGEVQERGEIQGAQGPTLQLGGPVHGLPGEVPDDGDDHAGVLLGAREIGSEKTDLVVRWVEEERDASPDFRAVLWCRFRPELDRLAERLGGVLPTFKICGAQPKAERHAAVEEFKQGDRRRPAVLVGQPQAGGLGLDFTTAWRTVFVSNDYNLETREQAEDRTNRRRQSELCLYWDILATGPDGQRTIDHSVVKALRDKQKIEAWTRSEWRTALLEE